MLVLIDTITADTECTYTDACIEDSARAILKIGCVINPLILRKLKPKGYFDRHFLVDGAFEYYSALRAKKIDSSFEAINAFVVDDDDEEHYIRKQVKIFRNTQ